MSDYNLNVSRWPDSSKADFETKSKFSALQRLNEGVKTEGINFTLEWKKGDDLDLHVKCACQTWTKFDNISCKTCNMERDIDFRQGAENRRKPAVEHIIFLHPENMINQELGTFVQNYMPLKDAIAQKKDRE